MSHYEKLKALKMGLASDFRTAIYARSISSKDYERAISGTPPLILSDSVGKPLVNWSITGNTVQDGEPTPDNPVEVKGVGDRTKNLFESHIRNATIDSKGVITSGGDYRLYIARVTPKTVYTIKASDIVSNTSYQVYAFFKDLPKMNDVSYNQSRVVPPQNKNVTVTVPENVKYIAVRYLVDDTKPQIELGSETTFYEPFGYKITEVSRGKNWFDRTGVTFINGLKDDDGNIIPSQSHFTEQFTKVKPDTDYIWSGSIRPDGSSTRVYFYDKNKKWISRTVARTESSHAFKTPSNCYYIQFQVVTRYNVVSDWQLELGDTATEYEPYHAETSEIYLSSPLMADEVLSSDDRREVEWGKYEFTGDEFITIAARDPNSSNEYLRMVYNTLAIITKALETPFCSHFKRTTDFAYSSNSVAICKSDNSKHIEFCISKNEHSTVDDFKAWLKSEYDKGTPVTVWYQLAEPTSEIVDVPQIPTLKGNCVLDVDTEVQPTNMSVTYKSRR